MSFVEITEEIFQVGGSGLTSPEDAAVYIINIDGYAALVDAGCGRSQGRLISNIRSCDIEPDLIEYLFITHCHFDHTGGVKGIKDKLPRINVVAHELEAPYLEQGDNIVTAALWYGSSMEPFSVDKKISGNEGEIMLGDRPLKAFHVPGHSPGSLVYMLKSAGNRVLFAQDVHGPLDASIKSDPIAYKESLKLLLTLEADILCEGHYGVFKGKKDVKEFIRSFL